MSCVLLLARTEKGVAFVEDIRDISQNPSPMALHGVASMGSQGVAECSSREQSLLLLDSTVYVYTYVAYARPLVDQIK